MKMIFLLSCICIGIFQCQAFTNGCFEKLGPSKNCTQCIKCIGMSNGVENLDCEYKIGSYIYFPDWVCNNTNNDECQSLYYAYAKIQYYFGNGMRICPFIYQIFDNVTPKEYCEAYGFCRINGTNVHIHKPLNFAKLFEQVEQMIDMFTKKFQYGDGLLTDNNQWPSICESCKWAWNHIYKNLPKLQKEINIRIKTITDKICKQLYAHQDKCYKIFGLWHSNVNLTINQALSTMKKLPSAEKGCEVMKACPSFVDFN